jgi:phosphatidylinositol glycan class U
VALARLQVYGFIFFAPDLTSNIGLFWYYFTEAFMHFRPFFIFVFQYHPVIYVMPLTIRFRSPPTLFIRTTAHASPHTHTRINF